MRAPVRRAFRRAGAVILVVGALTTSMAPAAGAGPKDRPEEARRRSAFEVAVGVDFDYLAVPERLKPGTYDFSFANVSPVEDHEIVFFRLKDRRDTVEDVAAAADRNDEDYFRRFRGVSFAGPLDVQEPAELEPGFFAGRADLTDAGRYAYICFIPQIGTGTPHYQLGMVGTLDVK